MNVSLRSPSSLWLTLLASASAALVGSMVACSSDSNGPSTTVDASTVTEPDSASPEVDGGPSVDSATSDVNVVPVGSSKGSGKLTCSSTGNLTGGRTYCVTTIAGSELKLAEPVAAAGPLRLVFYVHGDGAGAYKSDSAMKALLPFADQRHALVISVLSPNKCAWWQVASQTDCSATATPVPDTEGLNADTFKQIIDAVRAGFDVTNDVAFYYGSSGGSIFLTSAFMRRFGNQYPGVYALNCGGEKPAKPMAWDASLASERKGTKLYFTYGDQDFLKPDIEKAIPFFQGLGFPVDTKVIAGAEHCAFDAHGRAVEVFSAQFTP
jgi:hypothetical protein